MKVSVSQIQRGMADYIDSEIISKLTDWRRWIIGAGSSIFLTKLVDVFNQIKAQPIVAAMGIIDASDMVDIDLLYSEVKKQAMKAPITFEIPILGAMTMYESDVDKIYSAICRA